MNPLISVIMGVYNDERFLEEAIDSILNQTFSNFEFIICDDNSSDNSFQIINNKAQKDNRIRIIKNEYNCGLAESLNKCIDISKGEYIARMDSDDLSLKDRFNKQISFITQNPNYTVVGTNEYLIDDKGIEYGSFKHTEIISLDMAVRQTSVCHPSVLIRKKDLLAVGKYTVKENTLRAEDYDLWCKFLYNNYKIYNIQENLMAIRRSITSMKKRKFKFRIQEFKLKYEWYNKAKIKKRYYYRLIKPLVVGVIPGKLMYMYKKRKYNL